VALRCYPGRLKFGPHCNFYVALVVAGQSRAKINSIGIITVLNFILRAAVFSLCFFRHCPAMPCVLHFIFIEQDRPRPRAPSPEHTFLSPIKRQK